MKNPDIKHLPNIFEKISYIKAVYLFGSFVSGKINRNSDLDLAILLKDLKFRSKKLEILTELARNGFCNVDVVFFEGRDIVLEYEAIYHNRLIYAESDFDKGTFYSNIVRKFWDFYPYLKIQREAYKRRILDG